MSNKIDETTITNKKQFDAFYDENPQIAEMFLDFTSRLVGAGRVKIRAYEVLCRIRWELLMTGKSYDLIDSVKTTYANRYAMELMVGGVVAIDVFDFTVDA